MAQDILPKLRYSCMTTRSSSRSLSGLQKTSYLSIKAQEGKKNSAITRGKRHRSSGIPALSRSNTLTPSQLPMLILDLKTTDRPGTKPQKKVCDARFFIVNLTHLYFLFTSLQYACCFIWSHYIYIRPNLSFTFSSFISNYMPNKLCIAQEH